MITENGLEKAINYAADYGLQIKAEDWEIAVYWNGHYVSGIPDRSYTRLYELMAAIDEARKVVKEWIIDDAEIREE